jgi:cyclopropane fatty-acyl-phospholipid synthase-like methyltransferase
MRWNTPLSEAHADALIESLELGGAATILDLGCGWAELLIRVLRSADGDCAGIGVDTDGELLDRAAASIARGGLGGRIRLEDRSVTEWTEPADRVICIGTSHAWGGTVSALQGLRELVAPGGRLLFGDGCWEREPAPEARARALREHLDTRLLEYVNYYRGVLGFCYLVLAR